MSQYSVHAPSPLAKRARTRRAPPAAKGTKKKNITTAIPRIVYIGRNAFPPILRNTMTYCEEIGVVLDANGINEFLFSCNGLFSPSITTPGHQPLYYDQLMAIYNHYTVQSSKITITPVFSDIAHPCVYVLYQDDDSTTGTTTNTNLARERQGSKTLVAQPNDFQPQSLTAYWSIMKTFGNNGLGDSSLQGTVSASPSERSVWVCHLDAGVAGGTGIIHYLIKIEYNTVWDELVSMATS